MSLKTVTFQANKAVRSEAARLSAAALKLIALPIRDVLDGADIYDMYMTVCDLCIAASLAQDAPGPIDAMRLTIIAGDIRTPMLILVNACEERQKGCG
jgi:hypothetical protein